jgi:hypothetical protein
MGNSVEIFVANGGQVAEMNPTVLFVHTASPAINGNVMATRNETGRDLFSKRFEAAIRGGDAAGAEKRYSQE